MNKVSYATAGNGNPMHLTAAMFQNSSKAEMVQIPYQGSARLWRRWRPEMFS